MTEKCQFNTNYMYFLRSVIQIRASWWNWRRSKLGWVRVQFPSVKTVLRVVLMWEFPEAVTGKGHGGVHGGLYGLCTG